MTLRPGIDYEPAVCMNCGEDEHTPAQLRACVASIVGPTPENGVDRCACGCKYWHGVRCIDCGDRFDPREEG